MTEDPRVPSRTDFIRYFDSLFDRAWKSSGLDALFTILRVDGLSDANWDPYEESDRAITDFNWILQKTSEEQKRDSHLRAGLLLYCHSVEMSAPAAMICNMLRCCLKQEFQIDPFFHMIYRPKKKPFEWVPPSARKKFAELTRLAGEAHEEALVQYLGMFFDDRVRNAFVHSDYVITDKYFRWTEGGHAQQISLLDLGQKIRTCFDFYGAFMAAHKGWRLQFNHSRRFHKLPGYEVLEILTNEKVGLYGFHVHFSNGSKATFTRDGKGVQAINLSIKNDTSITFFVGLKDALEPVHKINGVPVTNWESLE